MRNSSLLDMNLACVFQYSRPCFITVSGLPGAGKTSLAQQMSRELQIYLLSNDYIRIRLQELNVTQHLDPYTFSINGYRMLKLLYTNTSFVFDRNFSQPIELSICDKISSLFGYDLVKIKIISFDEDNIKRISKRTDFYQVDSTIGDNLCYPNVFGREDIIKLRRLKRTF